MNLLDTTHLIKTYNGRKVVDEVSFSLGQQAVVGLLGRNGAGKTTTFRMILGMVTPDSGAVAFDGHDITHLPMYKRAKLGLGYLPQDRSDFRRLTVWQNLMAILETLPLRHSERNSRADRLLAQYGLTKQRNQAASTLSGGERRKMEIARALVTDPKLILLDEPFAGVDPIAKEELAREVRRLKDEFKKTVLITDHDVAFTLRAVDRALIIDQGKLMFEGTPREAINDPGVRGAYLGSTFRGDEFDDPALATHGLASPGQPAAAARQPTDPRPDAATAQPAAPRTPVVVNNAPAPAAPRAASAPSTATGPAPARPAPARTAAPPRPHPATAPVRPPVAGPAERPTLSPEENQLAEAFAIAPASHAAKNGTPIAPKSPAAAPARPAARSPAAPSPAAPRPAAPRPPQPPAGAVVRPAAPKPPARPVPPANEG